MGASEVVARVTRQVQMNTRMDESLKEAGDAVLRQLGYTPSTAVRGLWRFAVEHQNDPTAIRAVLSGERGDGLADRLGAIAEQRKRYARCAAELGIASEAREELPAWGDLRGEWYESRLAEMGEA